MIAVSQNQVWLWAKARLHRRTHLNWTGSAPFWTRSELVQLFCNLISASSVRFSSVSAMWTGLKSLCKQHQPTSSLLVVARRCRSSRLRQVVARLGNSRRNGKIARPRNRQGQSSLPRPVHIDYKNHRLKSSSIVAILMPYIQEKLNF